MIEAEKPPRRLRIVSGPIAVVEDMLNRLLDDYVATVWNFAAVAGEMHATVVLVAASEMRKAQLAGARMIGRAN